MDRNTYTLGMDERTSIDLEMDRTNKLAVLGHINTDKYGGSIMR